MSSSNTVGAAGPSNASPTMADPYLLWKSWESRDFGRLKKLQENYFRAQLRRAGFNGTRDSRVLEIGFGNGTFLRYAMNCGWHVEGTEATLQLVETAKVHGFMAQHLDDLSTFDSDRFDLVVAFDVLEHIAQAQLLDFLRQAKRVLRRNGIFIATFPNGDSPFGLYSQNGDVTHLNAIGSRKAEFLLHALEVEPIDVGRTVEPLLSGSLPHTLHRLFALPVKAIVNLLVNLVYFPGKRVAFCSSTLAMIFRKAE